MCINVFHYDIEVAAAAKLGILFPPGFSLIDLGFGIPPKYSLRPLDNGDSEVVPIPEAPVQGVPVVFVPFVFEPVPAAQLQQQQHQSMVC